MTELSGTLEGVGLPAIVRFLTGLNKTGCLGLTRDDWHGEILFDAGLVTSASLGSRHGLLALDAMVHAMRGGSFTFDVGTRIAAEPNISLSPEALQAHLDDLAIRSANGTSKLPPLDAVPALVSQDDSGSGEEPLPLDRGTLQTLLAVDGQRTVREIIAQRGSLDTLWQLGNLADVGLVRIGSNVSAGEPTPARAETSVAAPLIEQPIALEVGPGDVVSQVCPKLGFEDDPQNSFGRATRLHRCFAAGTPLPLSLDQQRELCLSDQYGTCPRLTMGAAGNPRDAQPGVPHAGVPGRIDQIRSDSESDDPRIVRLPFVARASASQRDVVGVQDAQVTAHHRADRQAVGASEPTRLRTHGSPQRDGMGVRRTPLRARIERSNDSASTASVSELATTPVQQPRKSDTRSAREALIDEPTERRIGGIPVEVIAGAAIVLVVLSLIGYLILPQFGGLFADDSIDLSALPNSSAVAAGTPVAQVTVRGAPPVVNSTTSTSGANAATTTSSSSAGAASAAASPAQPTLLPEPTQAAADRPTAVSQAAGAQQPAASARPDAAQPAAAGSILDEGFTSNARNWPSSPLGTANLTDGSYRITPRQATQFVAIGAPIVDVLQDVVVSATFHKLSGPAGGGYGIIVRDQASTPQNGTGQVGRYYVLEAGDKGEVGIWRREADRWVDLLPWQHADAVKPGSASNEITVRAVGNLLSLSVNGTQVATSTDGTYASGGVGLFVGGDGNQVSVDRFSVQTP